MTVLTAFKSIDQFGYPAPNTIAQAPALAADYATVYKPGSSYSIDIASELAQGVLHPGIVAFSSRGWAGTMAAGALPGRPSCLSAGGGPVLIVTFDPDTDLVETLQEGPGVGADTGSGENVSYRLSACNGHANLG